ncbi:MAG: CrcB family protein [Acidimicrobiia bacterium]|jgi:CrcB protein
MTLLLVSLAGSIGAVSRYFVSGWIQARSPWNFPVGTLTVNVLGSLALGLIVGTGAIDSAPVIAGVGFLGGFTTFSTWMVETARLGSTRGFLNLSLMLLAGVAAAATGLILTM